LILFGILGTFMSLAELIELRQADVGRV